MNKDAGSQRRRATETDDKFRKGRSIKGFSGMNQQVWEKEEEKMGKEIKVIWNNSKEWNMSCLLMFRWLQRLRKKKLIF